MPTFNKAFLLRHLHFYLHQNTSIKALLPPPLLLFLFLFLFLLRHLYLLKAKRKAKPIFKRGYKSAEDGKNNKHNKNNKNNKKGQTDI